jgi:hypothetical protein
MSSNERQQQLTAIGMHSRIGVNSSQPQTHQMIQQSHQPLGKVIAVPGYDTQEYVTLTYRLGIHLIQILLLLLLLLLI